MEIICNLTRFPGNAAPLSRSHRVVEAFRVCGGSEIKENRLWTMRSLQNLTADASCKLKFATVSIIEMLRISASNLEDEGENTAAISALANLCTDAAAVVQLSNSKSVIPTLISIAHNRDFGPEVQFHACNAMSRIAVWFQSFAAATKNSDCNNVAPIPTLGVKGNMRWDCNE
jgi:hypothetical protein